MSMGTDDKLNDPNADTVPFLSDPGEPTDVYPDYLSEVPQPAGDSSNTSNLFDDSDIVDRNLLASAQAYIKGSTTAQ